MYTVLYVEDSPTVFAQTAKMISRLGYFLYVAENGHEGLRIFQEVKPDIIITDISMSIMSGIELAREIRVIDENIQIILTVNQSESDQLLNTFDLNINHYLAKPIKTDQLANTLALCSQRLDKLKSIDSYKESQMLYVKALDSCPIIITITDANGNIQYINSKASEVTGKNGNDLLKQHISWLFESSSASKELFQNALINSQLWKGELSLKTADQSEIIEETLVSPVFGKDGKAEYFILFSEDITSRKEAEEEVRKLNAELEYRVLRRNALLDATNRELDEFCDAISHELCGPLSRLQGLSRALCEDFIEKLGDNGKEYLQRISQTSIQLKQIIDALVNLTQLTRRSLLVQDVNLSSICADVAHKLISSHPKKHIKFFIAPDIIVKGDKTLLKIVIESLLTNAWKNVEDHDSPQIEFGVARSNEKAVYFVRDNGCGFDPRYSDKLFKLFGQHPHTQEKSVATSGTELVAAQRIIQRHGGRIWAEGELDKGSTFYFTI
ncbi:cyanobacterial phytochrome B [Geobacter sp. OR-1]|uniref:sensor histidine kinase n=1 Tax=Geobacter sp. OR-1 TaxID=1266765 RepID=UPI0005419619|nr:response regulator [Geobacter sp. OR-1]GAM11653.1 cyanobacterial phytochrome B [Geobacter sp. OR-1]